MFKDVTRSGMTGFTFLGDRELCINYVSLARRLLIGNLQTNTLPQFRRRINLPDGASIELLSNRGINRIIIDVSALMPVGEVITVENVVIRFATGLFEYWNRLENIKRWHPAYPLENWQVGPVNPAADPNLTLDYYPEGHNDWIEANPGTEGYVFPIGNANDKAVKFAIDRNSRPHIEGVPSRYLPTMYSGSMVPFLQMYLSLGHVNVFSPTFNQTHILWSHGSGESKRWWIVEIGVAGVFAWPIEFLRKDNLPANVNLPEDFEANDDYAFYPLEAFTFDPTTKINVAGAAQIEDVYGDVDGSKGGMWTEYGWAADSDGHHAAIVVTARRLYDAGGTPGSIPYSWRYILTIFGGANGPSGVSLELDHEGWLYSFDTHYGFRAPDLGFGLCIYQNWDVVPAGGDDPSEGGGPVMCHYDKNDSLVTLDYEFEFGSGTFRIDNEGGAAGLTLGPHAPVCPGEPPSSTAILLESMVGIRKTLSMSSLQRQEFICNKVNLRSPIPYQSIGANESWNEIYGFMPSAEQPNVTEGDRLCGGVQYFFLQQVIWALHLGWTRDVSRVRIQQASGSLHSREAMLFYRLDNDEHLGYTEAYNAIAFGTIRSSLYIPSGSGGEDFGTYREGFNWWGGTGTQRDDGIPNIVHPAGTEVDEQLVAMVKNGIIELPAPGFNYTDNPFGNFENFTTFFAYHEGFQPEQVIMHGTGITGQYNESEYDTPESGFFQPLLAFFGNHDNPKPWED